MVKNKLKKIIVILLLITMLFPNAVTLAAISQEDAGKAIAAYAVAFCEKLGYESGTGECIYSWNDANRWHGYRLEKTSGLAQSANGSTNFTDKYPMDCVAFLSMVVHQSLGIGSTEKEYFLCPSEQSGPNTSFLEPVTDGSTKPGDLCNGKGHVWIEVGGVTSTKDPGAVTADSVCTGTFRGPHLTQNEGSGVAHVNSYRIKEEALNGVTPEIVNQNLAKVGTNMSGFSSVAGSGYEKSEFYYNGIPDGKYSVTAGVKDWIVNALSDLFEYIIGILTLSTRMAFVGWTAIFENMISHTIKNIDDDTDNDQEGIVYNQDPTTIQTEEEDTVTVESIIFNKIKVLDVNFFKLMSEPAEAE